MFYSFTVWRPSHTDLLASISGRSCTVSFVGSHDTLGSIGTLSVGNLIHSCTIILLSHKQTYYTTYAMLFVYGLICTTSTQVGNHQNYFKI